MKTAFIASTGRTGTTFFTTLFNECVENAWSLHEPKPAFRRRGRQMISRKHKIFEKYYFTIPRLKRHRIRQEEWYVEPNHHLATCYPFLRTVFPGTLIIHIVRDGRQVVTSWLNRYRYFHRQHLTPHQTGDREAEKKWNEWNPLQKLSWYWKTINNIAYENNPDLLIRFEDIFGEDNKAAYRILDQFDNIRYDSGKISELLHTKINKTKTFFFPEYDDWPSIWKQQFWEIAGEAMREYGYTE